jgi:hypothetical protein
MLRFQTGLKTSQDGQISKIRTMSDMFCSLLLAAPSTAFAEEASGEL